MIWLWVILAIRRFLAVVVDLLPLDCFVLLLNCLSRDSHSIPTNRLFARWPNLRLFVPHVSEFEFDVLKISCRKHPRSIGICDQQKPSCHNCLLYGEHEGK